MSSRWYYRLLGEEFGPVGIDALQVLVDDGTLDLSDEARAEGGAQWTTVGVALNRAHDVANGSSTAATSGKSDPMTAVISDNAADAWYFESFGNEFGPISFEELSRAAEAGQVGPDDQVRLGAKGKWRRAGSIGRLMTVMPFVAHGTAATYHSGTKWKSTGSTGDFGVIDDSDGDGDFEVNGTTARVSAAPATPAAPPPSVPSPSRTPAPAATTTTTSGQKVDDLWFAWIGGKQYGPVPMARLAQWLTSGQLTAKDHVRPAIATDWVLLSAMPELLDELSPVKTSVPPPPGSEKPASSPAPLLNRTSTPAPESRPTPTAATTPEATAPAPAASTPAPAPAPATSGYGGAPGWGASSAKPTARYSPPSKPSRSRGGGGSGGAMGDITKILLDWRVLAAVLVVGLGVGFFFLPESTADQIKDYRTAKALYEEVKDLREKKASQSDWEEWGDKATPIGKAFAKKYAKANAKLPAKQKLLAIGRDCIPAIMKNTAKPSNYEDLYGRYLKELARLLKVK